MELQPDSDAFVDTLCAALGLKSVTVRPREDVDDQLLVTGIHGRSALTTENRDVLRVALRQDPRPKTVGQLRSVLEDFVQDNAVSEVLRAVRELSERDSGRTLEHLCQDAGGKTQSAGN